MKIKLISIGFLTALNIIHLNANISGKISEAFTSENKMVWKNYIDSIQKIENRDITQSLQLLNIQYGYIAWCIKDNDKEIDQYIDMFEDNIKRMEINKEELSMIYAYKSALYGYKMILNYFGLPFYYFKIHNYASLSIGSDSSNYFSYIQLGNIAFFMPSILGGSKTKALSCYLKAKDLFESESEYIQNDWNYLSILIQIAQSFIYLNQYQMARNYLDMILKIVPGFEYVEKELYSKIQESH